MRVRAWLRWRLITWAVLLSVLTAGVAVVKEAGRREREADALFRATQQVSWKLGQAQRDRAFALYQLHGARGPGTGWTRREVEQAFPGLASGTPSQTFQPGGRVRNTVAFVDPQSYWRFEFKFDSGRWTGYRFSGGGPPASMRPPASSAMAVWLRLRKTLIPVAGIAWLALVLAGVVWRNHAAGPHLLHGSLVVGVALFGFAEAHPGYSILSTSNDDLLPGLVTPGVSLLLIFAARRDAARRRRALAADRICLTCGYDLRATPERCPECGTPAPGLSLAPV